MDVTLLGIVIEVKLLQFSKAKSWIVVKLLGSVIEVRALHSRKASEIFVILL